MRTPGSCDRSTGKIFHRILLSERLGDGDGDAYGDGDADGRPVKQGHPPQRRLRAFLRALRASLRLRFSLTLSTLRLGAWKPPRSAEGVFIRLASWLTS